MEQKIDALYNVLDILIDITEGDVPVSQEQIFARIASAYPDLATEFIVLCMLTFEKLKRVKLRAL